MNLFCRYKTFGENSKIIIKNVIGSFAVKGLSLIVSFVTTPLFIHYFNENRMLGVWYTLLSVLVWVLNFDLGLGNGIRNHLVKALSCHDMEDARRIISSGMFSVGIMTIVLTVVGIFLISLTNLNGLFNVGADVVSPETLRLSAIYVFLAIMLRFFLTTVTSVFYALQKTAVNNILTLCVSVLQMFYVLLAHFTSPEDALLHISFAYIFLSNLPVVVAGIWVFHKKLKSCRPSIRYVDLAHIKAITGIGAMFFVCQILYMLIANTNEFIVTSLYGVEATAEYTFYYKLTTLGTMVITLALSPIWSVVTKAQAEGNYVWLNKLYRYIKRGGVSVFVIQLLLVPFVPWMMNVWLGDGVVQGSYSTAVAFALFSSVFLYSGMLSTIASGMSMLKTQTISYVVAISIKIIGLAILYRCTSWNIVVWINTIALLPYIIAQQYVLNKSFSLSKSGGIR